jgi:hypothetical protein
VAQDLFIATLAVLTVVCGSVLLAMLWRRRKLRLEAARPRATAPSKPVAASVSRPIDDYALPVSLDAGTSSEEEGDVGKICPTCGSRYGSHFRYCERDNAELAALN